MFQQMAEMNGQHVLTQDGFRSLTGHNRAKYVCI
jgi:hypothetical protein